MTSEQDSTHTLQIPRLGLLGHATVVSLSLTASTYVFGYHRIAEALLVWSAFVGVFAVLGWWNSDRVEGELE